MARGLVAALLIAFAVAVARGHGRWVAWLWIARVPLLALLAFGGLPWWAEALPTMLDNLFDLSSGQAVALLVAIAWVTGAVVIHSLQVVGAHGPDRYDLPRILGRTRPGVSFAAGLLVSAPTIFVVVGRCTAPEPLARWLGLAVGLGVGASLLYGAGWLVRHGPIADLRASLDRGLRRLPEAETAGLWHHGTLAQAHLSTVAYGAVTLAVYLAMGWLFEPPGRDVPWLDRPLMPPALALLMIAFAAGVQILSMATFLLDRHRVPVLLGVGAIAYVLGAILPGQIVFLLDREPQGLLVEEQPLEASLSARLGRLPPLDPVVVVASAGGGIQAAGWTAAFMGSLRALAGDAAFTDRVLIMTGVSGGSVGTMYAVDALLEATPPDAYRDAVFARATAGSLDAATWGLLYATPLRGIRSALSGRPAIDRGWALERAWAAHLAAPDAALLDWQRPVLDGTLPLPIFQAMFVEDGRRLLLAPVHTPDALGGADALDVYPGATLAVTTAARLSATFPYVSPNARGYVWERGPAPERRHVADGGFFDNSGVFTALGSIDHLRAALRGRRVILVVLDGFPAPEAVPAMADPLISVAGPLVALTAARSTTQRVRDLQEIRWLAEALRRDDVHLEAHVFDAPVLDDADVWAPVPEPLSWQMSPAQIDRLCETFRKRLDSPATDRLLRALGAPTGGDRSGAMPTRCRGVTAAGHRGG